MRRSNRQRRLPGHFEDFILDMERSISECEEELRVLSGHLSSQQYQSTPNDRRVPEHMDAQGQSSVTLDDGPEDGLNQEYDRAQYGPQVNVDRPEDGTYVNVDRSTDGRNLEYRAQGPYVSASGAHGPHMYVDRLEDSPYMNVDRPTDGRNLEYRAQGPYVNDSGARGPHMKVDRLEDSPYVNVDRPTDGRNLEYRAHGPFVLDDRLEGLHREYRAHSPNVLNENDRPERQRNVEYRARTGPYSVNNVEYSGPYMNVDRPMDGRNLEYRAHGPFVLDDRLEGLRSEYRAHSPNVLNDRPERQRNVEYRARTGPEYSVNNVEYRGENPSLLHDRWPERQQYDHVHSDYGPGGPYSEYQAAGSNLKCDNVGFLHSNHRARAPGYTSVRNSYGCQPPAQTSIGSWPRQRGLPEPSFGNELQIRQSKLLFLATTTPVKFDGSPRDYPTFESRVYAALGDGLLTDSEKVDVLPKFLEGSALQKLESLRGHSFESIMARLRQAYGHPRMVANSFISAITTGPQLKADDRERLQLLSDTLTSTAESLYGEYLREAGCGPNIEKIVDKLPQFMKTDWEKKVMGIVGERAAPDLYDLAGFVDRHARAKNNPFYQSTKPETMTLTSGKGKFETRFHVKDVKVEGGIADSCVCCDENAAHPLWDCPEFKKMTDFDRKTLCRTKRLCYVCLEKGCEAGNCPKKGKSGVCAECTCRLPHNRLLRCPRPRLRYADTPPVIVPKTESEAKPASTAEAQGGTETLCAAVPRMDKSEPAKFLMFVMPVRVEGPNGSVTCYAFLDTGSTASFIDQTLADRIGLTGMKEVTRLSTVSDDKRMELTKVEFALYNVKTDHKIHVKDFAYSMKGLKSQLGGRPPPIDAAHLKDVDQTQRVDFPHVAVLVGLPVVEAHQVLEYRRGRTMSEPYVIVTKLGEAVVGPDTEKGSSEVSLQCRVLALHEPVQTPESESEANLATAMERFCSINDCGVEFPWVMGLSANEQLAVKLFDDSITQRQDGFFQCRLLWKDPDIELPYNREQVFRRFKSLERRFGADPAYAAMYKEAMDTTVKNGWASEIPEEEVRITGPRTFYLSHFGVTNENKPGKVRPVFDLAERHDGVSLNDCLLTGPESTSSLVGVLLRARTGQVAVASDVRSMFNMCVVAPEDRDSLRFIWHNNTGEIKDFRMNTHVFGAADSPYVANRILKQIAADHGDKYGEEIVNAVKENFYVDDAIVSAASVDDAIQVSQDMKSLLNEGGFSLVKFTSNERTVLQALEPSDLADPVLALEGDALPSTRALGLQWNLENDSFGVKIPPFDDRETMKGVVSVTAKLFDPIGIVSPVILTARLLAQECCKRGYDWNDPMPPDLLERWGKWQRELPALANVEIPRPYFPMLSSCLETGVQLQLHVFADASSLGTGCCVYLRGVEQDGGIHVGYVYGKGRVLPLKPKLTIPRAELKAAVDAVHIGEMIRKELKFEAIAKPFYWTDSEIVLKYLGNFEKHFHEVVANRVSEIRLYTTLDQWHFCPGKLNVSDDASRGVMPRDYSSDSRFLRGPGFLHKPEQEWPEQKTNRKIDDGDPEVKCAALSVSVCDVDEPASSCGLLRLVERSASWIRMRRVVAWILRWADAGRERRKVDSGVSVSVPELERAEQAIIGFVQRHYYGAEMSRLKSGLAITNPFIAPLNPFVDDAGILVVGGRLRNANGLDYIVKHPSILPSAKNCNISAIIARECHRTLGHGGKDLVVAKLREKFWIIHANSFVKSMISKCILCRKRNTQPMQQIMADLPRDRLSFFEPCFTSTGTDLFGPVYCKEGRRVLKCYGILFMCMTTMAMHIETVKWMTTDDFIAALMNFVSLRGGVKRIRSDNGSNYVGAEKELKDIARLWSQEQITDAMAVIDIEWKFQTPYASSQSGIWERRVRETKRHLYGLLNEQVPSPQVLRTLLYEVSAIMNQVLLCPMSSDPTSYEALTPGHFLFYKPATVLCPLPTDSDSRYRTQWRQTQQLADCFWKRFMEEYVPTLQTRKKWRHLKRNLSVGDLVLVIQSDLPRCRWLMGRVIEVFLGSDGNVRSARVRTKDGAYDRPIQKLGLLLENEK